MRKNVTMFLAFGALSLALSACATSGAPTLAPIEPASTNPAVTPTTIPPSPIPSVTPLRPTETPPPPTETTVPTETSTSAATPSGPLIAHFSSGQSFTVTYIHMLDASTGWAIGGFGKGSDLSGDHVFKTADSGRTWTDVTPPQHLLDESTRLTALGFFSSASSAWVTYSRADSRPMPASVVWRTQDGGNTWQASQDLDLSSLTEYYMPSDLLFVGDQNGWFLSHVGAGMNHDYVALFHTQDGGQTWTRLLDPYNDGGIQSCSKTGLSFLDAQQGWLTGDCNGVAPGVLLFRTTDSGSSWQPVELPEPPAAPGLFSVDANSACGSYDLQFSSQENGKLVVRCRLFEKDPVMTENFLYSTRDGGSTWTSSAYPGGTLLMLDATHGWAFGPTNYQTTDGGATWAKLGTVIWDGQFSFVNGQQGWAIAQANGEYALVNTTNSGKNWAEIQPAVGP